ncbi:SseB family protein [Streptomyces sp. JJ36]|uniref:SseB family protein n=1 Tax=Streptomyces sp. JJ36 TaxID=2736645 RepID=UPI001F284CF8|nr:SseB family protein [Streptomyces sp. JJ36]MCF6523190.1 SseB family protein [Streptomyces sp. JJ36]
MALKNIPDPGFSADDGSADPELARALAAWQADPAAEPRVLDALRGARLLVPVVAVLGEAETGPDGLRREKSSDMAVPTLTAPGGRRALPAFTSTEALARWQADARPVAVPLAQALRAAAQEGADTLLIDLAGPVTYELAGPALRALAARAAAPDRAAAGPGPGPSGPAGVTGEVAEALRTVLAADPEVAGAHLVPGGADSDGTLALALTPEAEPSAAARRVAAALAADEVLRARLVHGLDLAVLPPGSALPETALLRR